MWLIQRLTRYTQKYSSRGQYPLGAIYFQEAPPRRRSLPARRRLPMS